MADPGAIAPGIEVGTGGHQAQYRVREHPVLRSSRAGTELSTGCDSARVGRLCRTIIRKPL